MENKIMNVKVKLATGRKLHALAERSGETILNTIDRIVEAEWMRVQEKTEDNKVIKNE